MDKTAKKKQSKIYNKANSVLELRTDQSSRERALKRIKTVQDTLLQQDNSNDQRRNLVLTACHELLGQESTGKFWLRDHVVEEIDRLRDDELERYLYYRYRYDVYPSEHITDSYPPCVQIEPASICNFRCVFCYQTDRFFTDKKNGHMGMMSLDLFKKVVDQIEGEVESVTLASRGEPLLSPHFSDMVTYLAGKFLAVKVNTNASLLDERKSHEILKSDMQTLVFSVDAASEPLYSSLRVNGNLEVILKNIERFLNIKEKQYSGSRLITRVSGVAYSEEQDINEMKQFWGRLVDQVVFVSYNPWENVYDTPPNGMENPCSDLWRRLFVWWDGRINPCDVDYRSALSIGTMSDKTISGHWQGERFERLREQHLKGLRQTMYPCSGCSLV